MKGPPERMRAAYVDALGPARNIRVGELSVPVPGPTDVLVRVDAAAVNLVDTFVRSGAYPTATPFPFVVGRDLVGTVAARGAGVSGFAAGEPVWCNSMGHGGRQGAAAEYALVPAGRLYRLPGGADPVTAVAVAHPGATAHLALSTHGGLGAGQTVYIAGGAGHVGAAAIVLARGTGSRVLVSASAADADYCRSLGADATFDYRDEELTQRLRAAAPDGVHLHLNTSGRHDLAGALDVLAPRGRIVLMSGIDARPELPAGPLYTMDRDIIGFAISNATIPELSGAAARLDQLTASGALVPRRIEELPLDAASEAHRRLETGGTRGTRLILRPQR